MPLPPFPQSLPFHSIVFLQLPPVLSYFPSSPSTIPYPDPSTDDGEKEEGQDELCVRHLGPCVSRGSSLEGREWEGWRSGVGVVVGKEMVGTERTIEVGRVAARAEIVAVVVVVPEGGGVGWGRAARRDRGWGMEVVVVVVVKGAWMRVVGGVLWMDPVGETVMLKGLVPLNGLTPSKACVSFKESVSLNGFPPSTMFSPLLSPVKLAQPAPEALGPLLAAGLILGAPEGCSPPGVVVLNLGLLEEKIGKKGAMLMDVDGGVVDGTAI